MKEKKSFGTKQKLKKTPLNDLQIKNVKGGVIVFELLKRAGL